MRYDNLKEDGVMRNKEIAIIGAGKIGRGYLADLFSRAGYHLIFINGSPVTIDKLRGHGHYTLFTAKADGVDKRVIDGVPFQTRFSGLRKTPSSCGFNGSGVVSGRISGSGGSAGQNH